MSSQTVSAHNLPSLIRQQAAALKNKPAMYFKSDQHWKAISYSVLDRSVQAVAKGLLTLGVEPGDKVGIISQNRPEWTMADLGIQRLGGVVVPLYPTSTREQIEFIVADAEIEVLFVGGQEEYDAVQAALPALPNLRRVIVFVDSVEIQTSRGIHFSGFAIDGENSKSDDEVDAREKSIRPDDVATIIYTSGTTGNPKGVMLSHTNFFHQFLAVNDRFEVGESDRSLCFLPLSHIFERAWSYYVFARGAANYYLTNPKRIIETMREVKPTTMVGVPRLYEKIYATVYDRLERTSPLRQRMFKWAVETGTSYAFLKHEQKPISLGLRVSHLLADRLVLRKIRGIVGGRKNFFAAGGAALSKDVELLFFAAGLLVCQGYGMTETSPMITCNCASRLKFGTVGQPVKDCRVRIAENGEIQVKGPNVMKGYYNNPEATEAAFTDGWLRTGDIGDIDADGFVRVTDRIKDLIITSGGKNIAPQNIETAVGKDHYIEQIAVVGDGRKYVAALVMPSFEALEQWARQQKLKYGSREELVRMRKVVDFFKQRIADQSRQLASFEQIKKFHLLTREFTVARGEITPTLKIKRKVVTRKYRDVIDRLYSGDKSSDKARAENSGG